MRTTVYLPEAFRETYGEFQKALSRNGSNVALWFREEMVLYVSRYGDSEQTHLTTFSEGENGYAEIEREIKTHFTNFAEKGRPVQHLDIIIMCRNRISNAKMAVEMADRIRKVMSENGLKVWQ